LCPGFLWQLDPERHEIKHHLVLEYGRGLEYLTVRQSLGILEHLEDNFPSFVSFGKLDQFFVCQLKELLVELA
jgi:hypothetical protein